MRMTSAPICAIVMPPSGAATKADISTIRRSWRRRFIPPSCPALVGAARPSRLASRGPLGSGDERAQRTRLVLDLVEPVLDHIADADDAAEAPVLDHREMADAAVRHFCHQLVDTVGGIASYHPRRHHFRDLERQEIGAASGKAVHNVALRYDPVDTITVLADDEGANIAGNQRVHRGADRLIRPDRRY